MPSRGCLLSSRLGLQRSPAGACREDEPEQVWLKGPLRQAVRAAPQPCSFPVVLKTQHSTILTPLACPPLSTFL